MYKEVKVEENEETINKDTTKDIKFYDINMYDPNKPVDALFIIQEKLYQRHNIVEAAILHLKNNKHLKIELEEIKEKAKENADAIFKLMKINENKEQHEIYDKQFEKELKAGTLKRTTRK